MRTFWGMATLFAVVIAPLPAFADGLGKETAVKVGRAEKLDEALEIARAEFVKNSPEAFQQKYRAVLSADIDLIRSNSAMVAATIKEKKWEKSEGQKAIVSAWGYLRGKMIFEEKRELAMIWDDFFAVFNALEYVKITSTPKMAQIKAGFVQWGQTDDDGYLPLGPVTIRISLADHEDLVRQENVVAGKTNDFKYELKKKRLAFGPDGQPKN